MGKHIRLRMAKASQDDIDGGYELGQILDAIDKGYYPTRQEEAGEEAGDAPTFFDADDIDHLQHLHRMLMDLLGRRPGFSLFRVVMGMETILRNNILDPDDDCIELHPRFAKREQELAAQVDLLRDALFGIVGPRTAPKLAGMKAFLEMAAPDGADKAASITAIDALLATMPVVAADDAEVRHG